MKMSQVKKHRLLQQAGHRKSGSSICLKFAAFALAACLFCGMKDDEETLGATNQRNEVSVEDIAFSRTSPSKIQVSWGDGQDKLVKRYLVKRRSVSAAKGTGKWKTIYRVKSDGKATGKAWSFTDALKQSTPQLYEYRIAVEVSDKKRDIPAAGKTIPASNIMVCLDPGHYQGKNEVLGEESYGFVEGDFILKLAKKLKKELKGTYGISSYMTRSTGDITLGGYTNLNLDSGHISLRGEYAAKKKSNLFVSLHTNANSENANGHGTYMQPIAANKAIVFANTVAGKSDAAIATCNSIGLNLSAVNKQLGLSKTKKFKTVKKGHLFPWDEEYNDGLNKIGTVACRLGRYGDYYGVLRGASNVGVPGVLIEHGMHTVPEVRKAAAEGTLAKSWAAADAYGIAYGFGFVKEMAMPGN